MAPEMNCPACKKHISIMERLQCVVCSKYYHCECVSISKDTFNTERHNLERLWNCPVCTAAKSRQVRDDDAPVRKSLGIEHDYNINKRRGAGVNSDSLILGDSNKQTLTDSLLPASSSASCKDQRAKLNARITHQEEAVISSDLAVEMQLLRVELSASRAEMTASRAEMQELRSVISSLTAAVKSCNSRIDDLTARVDSLENNRAEPLPVTALEQTITDLKLELNEREQELLCNDIEIAGIPEEPSELPIHLTLNIAAKLGVSLEERDIVSAERLGPVRRTGPDGISMRPRPLIVRLVRRVRRDEILKEARVRRNVTTAGLGLTSAEQRFYVNERLSRSNRNIFYKARSESQRVNWKYVWTRNGKIYARRAHGESYHCLRSEDDVKKIFGLC